ncbi:unnamed protein product [Tilletia laevis]|uniref:NADH dehydrogenase [ubiquinone] 1 alpha subcomplex subunit n=2 Tax=Tilletia TaxID=13289 RepID=A0A177V8X7_9BASI|nr:hypothetical protein CF336_g4746 [Tilletia laevis]KAE8252987.1 hypothetical protein A4X03_0g6017 [Tilletia caries]KAE8200619.1 hypothetical protein CF335_g3923 [Tilletia laevis]CAD6889810.1 unnamed protein product [Tilletia caries]CAD6915763.1 unnamed protein product [Tilletia laevis]
MLKTISSIFRVGRSRYFVGYDLNGNSYHELPSRSGSTDPRHTRRSIDWKEKLHPAEYDQSSIPAQWGAWLRHTRRNPPTLEELQMDAERIIRVRANAKLIDERDAAWRASLLQAPPEDAQARLDARLLDGVAEPASSSSIQAERTASASAPSAEASRSRRRSMAAVPTSEVRSELVDGDRAQRGNDLASRSPSSSSPSQPTKSTSSSRSRAVPLPPQTDAEALNDDAVRRPDDGVWEASRQRLRNQ